jgi:hypothetical protein
VRSPARATAIDVAALVVLKAALGAWVLHLGFTHVSDDDYARVVIAELFAHAPKLDPSGTSWLPFPFWTVGGAMMVVGRSLHAARVIAFVSGAASVALVYLALRRAGVARSSALLGVALAMATPWNAWLGVATVPEAVTGALVACGAILASVPAARPAGAACLLAAALSRYEAWPVAGVFALVCAASAARGRGHERTRDASSAAIAAAGPLAWMAWNAHAHDGPLHFLRRVAAFRSAVAPGAGSLASFPRALVAGAPEIALVAVVGAAGLVEPETRRRWAVPLACSAAVLAFLVVGDWRGGAPTHHPERALVGVWWVLGTFGVDGALALGRSWAWARPKREAWVAAVGVAAALSWCFRVAPVYAEAPGTRAAEDRRPEEARGEALAVVGGPLRITPCAYEHFALIAAFGAPEAVTTAPAVPAHDGTPCPEVIRP